MKILLLILPILLLAPFSAEAQYIVKDSAYFTMDDGIQTKEEMEEEAFYLHEWCTKNLYQATYFNCDCLAGAFLNERERLGPTVPQGEIMRTLTKTPKAVCGNTERIAGTIYDSCMSYAEVSRELESDNEEYCSCIANKTARDFTKNPRLNVRYIRSVRAGALSYCRDPQNRPVRSTESKTDNWLSSSPTQ